MEHPLEIVIGGQYDYTDAPQVQNDVALDRTEAAVTQDSRLLNLPGELRNQIYGHVFCQEIEIKSKHKLWPTINEPPKSKSQIAGLLRTCRIAHEATMLVFQHATFVCEAPLDAMNFLDELEPTQRDAIRNMVIEVRHPNQLQVLSQWRGIPHDKCSWGLSSRRPWYTSYKRKRNTTVEFVTRRFREELPALKNLVLRLDERVRALPNLCQGQMELDGVHVEVQEI